MKGKYIELNMILGFKNFVNEKLTRSVVVNFFNISFILLQILFYTLYNSQQEH